MVHINLTNPDKKTGLAKYMVSYKSNNFGDQLLELKQHVVRNGLNGLSISQYVVLDKHMRTEGDWMQIKDMKLWLKNTIKESKG